MAWKLTITKSAKTAGNVGTALDTLNQEHQGGPDLTTNSKAENFLAQTTAFGASFAGPIPTIVASVWALHTSINVIEEDIAQGADNKVVLGDISSIIGDAAEFCGGILELTPAAPVGAAFEVIGQAATFAGLGLEYGDTATSTVAQLAKNVLQEVDSLNTQLAFTMSSAEAAIGSAWETAEGDVEHTINSMMKAANAIGSGQTSEVGSDITDSIDALYTSENSLFDDVEPNAEQIVESTSSIFGSSELQSKIDGGALTEESFNSSTDELTLNDDVNEKSLAIYYDPDGTTIQDNYGQLNQAGPIVSQNINDIDGSSVLTTYNPDGSSTSISYSAPDGTGSITQLVSHDSAGKIIGNEAFVPLGGTVDIGLGGNNTIVTLSPSQINQMLPYTNVYFVTLNFSGPPSDTIPDPMGLPYQVYFNAPGLEGTDKLVFGTMYQYLGYSDYVVATLTNIDFDIEPTFTETSPGKWSLNYEVKLPSITVSSFESGNETPSSGPVEIVDTVANLHNALPSLQSGVASIESIRSNNGPIDLNVAEAASYPNLLEKFVGGFSVSDLSSNVMSGLDGLELLAADGEITEITLEDNGTPHLALTSTQVSADQIALGKVQGSFTVSETAGVGATSLTAGGYVDVLSAGSDAGVHVLNAGLGTNGSDTLYGGIGADTLNGTTSYSGSSVLIAGVGQNVLNGGLGYDTLYGGGQSVLNAGASNQKLLGGYSATASDTLNAGSGNYEFLATVAGHDLLLGGSGAGDFIEGGTGADTLMGSTALTGAAVLIGGSGANLLDGGAGADTLVGGGASSLLAGTGSHQILLGGYSPGAHDTLNAGSDSAVIGVAQGNNMLLAGTGTASLYGGAGNDLLQGGGGNGVLVAGTGHSTLQAGSGSDFLVGNGQSLLLGGSGASGVSVLIGGFSAASHDTLKAGTGSGETLAVVTGNNQLFADSTSLGDGDVLYSGTGNDTLYGAGYGNSGASAQTAITDFVVGQGNSTVLGGAGNDYIAVLNGTGSTSIDGGGGANIVQFTGHTAADATITTNAAGVTTVTFADSSQTTTLAHIAGLQFSDSNAVHALG